MLIYHQLIQKTTAASLKYIQSWLQPHTLVRPVHNISQFCQQICVSNLRNLHHTCESCRYDGLKGY